MDNDYVDPESPPTEKKWRLRFVALMFLLAFMVVLGRLFYIQIIRSADYQERARKQYEARVDLRPTRGTIRDRAGRTIASTVQSVSYAVDPKMLENADHVCTVLSRVCGLSKQSLLAKIAAAKDKNFVWLARGYTLRAAMSEVDSIHDVGFIRLMEPKRNYLYGAMAAQLVGCTDVDNNGLAGIELAYDSLLRGESGFEVMQRDGRGRLRQVIGADTKAARNGSSLELTIDVELQSIVEQELQSGLSRAGALGGTAIAMDPATGEILAIASRPAFNPNNFRDADAEGMRLRSITDMYEPGSTFKLVTAAAALEHNLVQQHSTVDGLNGQMVLKDGTVIRDHEALGNCALQTALDKSSNIVFANLARRIPDDQFYKITRDFGFGIPVGIELGGESRGILKMPAQYDYSTKLYMGFGYQLAATAVQLAAAYATVANKGVMMKPYIVKRVLDDNNNQVREIQPQKIRRVISYQTSQILAEMFSSVVQHGTGTEARIPGLAIAGKTGTAQQLVNGKYSREAYTASFIGFFPADSAEMVLLVMLDKPKTDIYGGKTAAPIFRNIVQRILSTPTVNENFPALARLGRSQPMRDSVVVPELRGMECATALRVLHEKGLRCNRGDDQSVVLHQSPKSGSVVVRGSEISLQLSTDVPEPPTEKTADKAQRPDVRGLSSRRAVAILHAHNIVVRVNGRGRVQSQTWSYNKKQLICTLTCRE